MRLVAVFKESEHRLKMVQTCANHRSNPNGEFHFRHSFMNMEQQGFADLILLSSSNYCAKDCFVHKMKQYLVNIEIHVKLNCICQVITLPSTR